MGDPETIAGSAVAEVKLCGAKDRWRGGPCQEPGTGRGGRCHRHGGASTGPKTAAGKAEVAGHAVKHGYYSRKNRGPLRMLASVMPSTSDLAAELRLLRAQLSVVIKAGGSIEAITNLVDAIRRTALAQHEVRDLAADFREATQDGMELKITIRGGDPGEYQTMRLGPSQAAPVPVEDASPAKEFIEGVPWDDSQPLPAMPAMPALPVITAEMVEKAKAAHAKRAHAKKAHPFRDQDWLPLGAGRG